MPPKAKITREMVINAAFEIARSEGAEKINARTVSQKLKCSTQPVMYHFSKIEDIKKAVYEKADEYHSSYITDIKSDEPMKEIGLLYIRFANEEKHLFRFLFQSNEFSGQNISELIDTEEIYPVLAVLSKTADVGIEQAKIIFKSLFLFAHGYASMLSNNSLEYDENVVSSDLERMLFGALCSLKEGL